MKAHLRQHGVTLIELLMAIAIIAVISSIAIPMYSDYISTARETEAWYNISSIKMAEEEYYLENNAYFPAAGTSVNSSDGSLNPFWVPESSSTGSEFYFTVSTNDSATQYTITATGKGDKVPSSVVFTYTN